MVNKNTIPEVSYDWGILEDIELKIYWRIGEIAQELNIASSAIRYWEGYFGKLYTKRAKNGDRLFNKAAFLRVIEIYKLVKVEGYTLKGAKRVLSERKGENIRKEAKR